MRMPRPSAEVDPPRDDRAATHGGHGGHGGHGLMMMLMCVPMLFIAGLLVVTGAWGSGAIVAAVLCMAMMAAMMFMMPGGRSGK